MKAKHIVLALVAFVAYVVAMVFLFNWIAVRDEMLMEATDIYEKCVKEEYNTTPFAYRAEHGEYPECNSKEN